MSYNAYVTILTNVQKDPNSDNLYTARVMGENVIVGGTSYDGERVLYLPADGAVERWFGDLFGLFRKNLDGTKANGYLDDNGHIKALKLRGLRSEGIVIPWDKVIEMIPAAAKETAIELSSIDGRLFVKKYIPNNRHQRTPGVKTSYKGKKSEGIIYPEFSMHSDTAQLAYNEAAFTPGDIINMSLKMHGCSQRSMNTYAELPNGFFRRLFRMKKKTKPAYIMGTRRVAIGDVSKSTGYYGSDAFRVPHHEAFRNACLPGMEIFYEVVGWVNDSTSIMPSADNSKLGKDFMKQFGKTTDFTYGCERGESQAYIYRITAKNGDYEFTPEEIVQFCEEYGFNCVPQIDNFVFTTWDDLLTRVNAYFEDLFDPIGKSHIKEGVVVRIVNKRTFTAFKSKTYEFKVLEGIIKETAETADIEEAQDIEINN